MMRQDVRRRPLCGALGIAICVGVFGGMAAGEDPPFYVRKATWVDSMLASQEALTKHLDEIAPDVKLTGKRARIKLGRWYTTGDIRSKGGRKNVLSPEQGPIDLKAFRDEAKKRPLWTEQTKWKDHVVTPLRIGKGSCQYLYRALDASADGQAVMYLGSGDGMTVWLNGKSVLVKDVQREAAPNQERLTLDLRKGRNDLLVRIYNHEGTAGFYFSTQARPRTMTDIFYAQIWELLRRDFPDAASIRQMGWEQGDRIWEVTWSTKALRSIADRYARATKGAGAAEAKKRVAEFPKEGGDLGAVRELYLMSHVLADMKPLVEGEAIAALRRAIEDLTKTFPGTYTRGAEYLAKLDRIEKVISDLSSSKKPDVKALAKAGAELGVLRTEALLANPLLNFDKLLVVKRSMKAPKLGLPQNWQGNCSLPKSGFDNEIAVLSPVRPGGKLTTLHKPDGGKFVGDVDLHWDAGKMLFSSIGANGRWQIFETTADGKVRQVSTGEHDDVDNYDACYLPDERVIFGSTRCFTGVPCVGGGSQVANLFLMNADGGGVRQLTFDQDHGWCPTVMNDGRVLYARWEYSDAPHYFTRLLMRMNPDGTGQMAYYGSNSYWPNSTFYARPIPNDPAKVIGVISGHHGVPRMGELILFDPGKGRFEADGVVQRIPGWGKEVKPVIADGLVNGSWPRFLHPYPLSDPSTGLGAGKYFLVSCQPNAKSDWSLYLVDVFDNMLLLHAEAGYAILEPVPLRKTTRPPVIPDKVNTGRKDALIYMTDVYRGGGLAGVPRGTVKKLRVYEFHYAYNRMGGHISIGIDGPWDVHRILGTVPVEADGSASFRVPANTPIAVQPLDEEGKALQLMRSWFTAMPGETLSCVGCHEKQNNASPNRRTIASTRPPAEIAPWLGPPRGFSFRREVQPVLDTYCLGCHGGDKGRPDFRSVAARDVELGGKKGKKFRFTPSYVALHPYARRPGPESDYHMMPPAEYHADGSELVQMLRKGHGGVKLSAEAWSRLITWIDLNVPDHGTWGEHRQIHANIHERRLAMRKAYASINDDPEEILPSRVALGEIVKPAPLPPKPARPSCPGWPFDAAEAKKRQAAAGQATQTVDLGGGVKLDLTLIPPGEFVMGDAEGWTDEWPPCRVKIREPYLMGTFEITNRQYALFDPAHDSRYVSWYNKDQSRRGEPANGDTQPVIRVSWRQATAFCRWLSERTGLPFTLPTEAQWEYACRAGTETPMSYGAVDVGFGKLANFADRRIDSLTRRDSPKWIPSIDNVDDGATATASVGRYAPNAWGLRDMHGNAAEWTLSTYRPYPYRADDGRNDGSAAGRKVVRGGSYYDRPKRGRSSFRLSYASWQRVHNAGFRVVCPVTPGAVAKVKGREK